MEGEKNEYTEAGLKCALLNYRLVEQEMRKESEWVNDKDLSAAL